MNDGNVGKDNIELDLVWDKRNNKIIRAKEKTVLFKGSLILEIRIYFKEFSCGDNNALSITKSLFNLSVTSSISLLCFGVGLLFSLTTYLLFYFTY